MKQFKKIFFIIGVLTFSNICLAQDIDPGDPDANVPIDGGVSLLVVAAAGYGAKKLNDARKKAKE